MNWDRVERLFGAETLATLRQKHVVIVGLGSGGGFVAQSLVMSGISKLTLIDDDALEESNIVRHVADLRDVGRPKVEAVRDLLLQRNPTANITAIIGRIEDHQAQLASADVVICGVDGEGTKFMINEVCLALNLPALYAGVYERGEGGDVVLIKPYDGPCYACWAANLREGYVPPEAGDELDYGLINERGTLDAEPGLWLHIVRVAAAQADMAIQVLLGQALPGNTVIIANSALEIMEGVVTPPYSAQWLTLERDPDCLVCGQKASVDRLALDDMDLVIFDEEDELDERESSHDG